MSASNSSDSSTSSANNDHPLLTCTLSIDDFNKSSSKCARFLSPSRITSAFVLSVNARFETKKAYLIGEYTAFSIYLDSLPNQGRVTIRYRMSIVKANGHCNTQEGMARFSQIQKPRYRGLYLISRDDLFDPANGWLVNGVLTVHCEIYKINSNMDTLPASDDPTKQSTILKDYGKLFENGKLSDLVLVAGGAELKAHRLILSARSAVFGAMFDHDTKEKQENRIEIKDVSAEACKELLRYIYTDKVANMKENALDLMAAADKYQLEHLKSTCERYLIAHLTTESVALTLVMADMYRAESLKAKCIDYISSNGREVKATGGWEILLGKPELLAELFLHSSNKNRVQ